MMGMTRNYQHTTLSFPLNKITGSQDAKSFSKYSSNCCLIKRLKTIIIELLYMVWVGLGRHRLHLNMFNYTNRDSYKRIYWITAVDQAALLSGYQEIAMNAGLKRLLNLTPVEIVKGVLSWLTRNKVG